MERHGERRRAIERDQQGRGQNDPQTGQREERYASERESPQNRGAAPQRRCRQSQQRRFALNPTAGRRQSEVHHVRSAQRQQQADPKAPPQRLFEQQPGQQRGEDRLRFLQQDRGSGIADPDGLGEADGPQRGAAPADAEQRSPLPGAESQPLGAHPPQRNQQRRRENQV